MVHEIENKIRKRTFEVKKGVWNTKKSTLIDLQVKSEDVVNIECNPKIQGEKRKKMLQKM